MVTRRLADRVHRRRGSTVRCGGEERRHEKGARAPQRTGASELVAGRNGAGRFVAEGVLDAVPRRDQPGAPHFARRRARSVVRTGAAQVDRNARRLWSRVVARWVADGRDRRRTAGSMAGRARWIAARTAAAGVDGSRRFAVVDRRFAPAAVSDRLRLQARRRRIAPCGHEHRSASHVDISDINGIRPSAGSGRHELVEGRRQPDDNDPCRSPLGRHDRHDPNRRRHRRRRRSHQESSRIAKRCTPDRSSTHRTTP